MKKQDMLLGATQEERKHFGLLLSTPNSLGAGKRHFTLRAQDGPLVLIKIYFMEFREKGAVTFLSTT